MHVHIALADGSDGLARAARLRQTQTGDRDSLNGLMAEHDGLLQAVVRQQALSDLPFAEALQAGRVGLWRAILGYAPQRGAAFSAYGWPCMMRQTGLTWGNLSSHMSKLEAAGYIEVEKEFVNKKPRTMLRLTDEGRAAFQEYVQTMKQVFDGLPPD